MTTNYRIAKHDRVEQMADDPMSTYRRLVRRIIGVKAEPYRDHISEFEARCYTGQLVDLGDGCYMFRKG